MEERLIYADTSFLVSHFVDDGNTDAARQLLQGHARPLMISPLCRLEYQTAMWQRVGRREFEPEQARRACSQFRRQEELGWFAVGEPDIEFVWLTASWLAEQFTASLKLRSLDIWHVAYALRAKASGFWSFDLRQRALAQAVGLV